MTAGAFHKKIERDDMRI